MTTKSRQPYGRSVRAVAYFTLSVCAAVTMVCTVSAACYEKRRIRADLEQRLGARSAELARSVAIKDWVLAREIASTLHPPYMTSLQVTIADGPTFHFPESLDGDRDAICFSGGITRYGLLLGTAEGCLPVASMVRLTLAEPVLIVAICGLWGLCMAAAIVRLNRYRKAIAKTTEALQIWATAPATKVLPASDDTVVAQVIALVKNGVDKSLDLARMHHDHEVLRQRARQAARVAHDIRAPVAALDMVITTFNEDLPKEVAALVREAVRRIKDIADHLLADARGARQTKGSATGPMSLLDVVNEVLAEARLRYRTYEKLLFDLVAQGDTETLYTTIPPGELRRVLFNLTNNSVEAMGNVGKVYLLVGSVAARAYVEIRDTGGGMPAAALARLGQEGATFNKVNGNGIGLHHAFEVVERAGAALVFCSEATEGTTARLTMPPA